ncbi:MAG: tRNA lysidine(34) synthetase TilS [Methyloprofundus sp.]|nr:tRNA lysidine(34) synthetase TilS [Methyloprofundus sp.]
MKLTPLFITSQLLPYRTADKFIIGYSGGVDSHVLLHLLANLSEFKGKVTALYIHHGLQADADEWAIHCQHVAHNLNVDFKVLHVNAQPATGQSPEEAARNARYQAFKNILTENDILLFAQHQNDQLETVLLQLFRGAGLKGLSGMPAAIDFAAGTLIRPLLDVTQQEVLQYARQHKLQWIEDPSNQDMQFDRNYLRQKIIPLLEQRWPAIDVTVSRVAEHCAQAQAVLSASAQEKMRLLYDSQGQCLSISGLLAEDDLSQQWIIREWMHHLGVRMPSQKVMFAILQDVLLARQEAKPVIRHDGYHIQRYRDKLYLVPDDKKPDLSQVIVWAERKESLALADNGQLQLKEAEQGIARHVWEQGNVLVQYRQGGEKIALANRVGRHSLKKLYQEAGIAPWQRDVIPLIYINGELVAIADYWVSADFYVQGEECVSLLWEHG